MSSRYTVDGKRKSSMVHARRIWTCPCGKTVRGNGGKSSHRRACGTWTRAELARLERLLADAGNTLNAPYLRQWAAERDEMRNRLGLTAGPEQGRE